MGHQVGGQHVGRRHPGTPCDVVDECRRVAAGIPYRVDVPLRVERQRLAVLGQVYGQLRHPQDRIVEPDQSVGDPAAVIGRAHR